MSGQSLEIESFYIVSVGNKKYIISKTGGNRDGRSL